MLRSLPLRQIPLHSSPALLRLRSHLRSYACAESSVYNWHAQGLVSLCREWTIDFLMQFLRLASCTPTVPPDLVKEGREEEGGGSREEMPT